MINEFQSDHVQQSNPKPNTRIPASRQRVIDKLDEIVARTTAAMAERGITYTIFFSVPLSGDAFITTGTTNDPPDAEWEAVCNTVMEIVQETLDVGRLRHRPIVCAQTRPTVANQEQTA